MGARFAPPFAIIYMHYVESTALRNLTQISEVTFYMRYIDDILMSVKDASIEFSNIVLHTFNRVDNNIQFTIQQPDKDGFLPFLDIEVKSWDSNFI
jgi:hypothetical protein